MNVQYMAIALLFLFKKVIILFMSTWSFGTKLVHALWSKASLLQEACYIHWELHQYYLFSCQETSRRAMLPASDSWRRNVFIHWKRNWNRDRLKKNNNNHNHWNTHTHILLSYLFVKLFAYCICNFSKITGNPCFLGDLNYGELIQAGTNANPVTQVTE